MPTLGEMRLVDLLDILFVATLIWLAIAWFRNSRARLALLGLAALAALFGVAQTLQLQLTTLVLQGFFAVVAVMLVVVFQDDLRRLFEGIAVWGLRRNAPKPPPDVEDSLVSAMMKLAEGRVGALVVLPGREPLGRHLEGGMHLDGRFSEPLLLSLFDAASPGHDGAILVRANKIIRFGAHLPLSNDRTQLGPHVGTRHAAALGLAERSDALCLVVSEERGEISVARGGEIKTVESADALRAEIDAFVARFDRTTGTRSALSRIGGSWREALLALGLAAVLWYIAIPGGARETVDRRVPIVVENLPEGYRLVSVSPADVAVRFEGRRRDLYMASATELAVEVDALLVQLGRRTFSLSLDQVKSPEEVRAVSIEPAQVKLSIKQD
ncbi:MAG: diadenylate cyclase [Myxococcota bacterium]|nr:hypothetical protein [Spirochaeta sp.]RPG03014.1 MAG: hypothetical protein CBC32_016655 [Proteobacteria bacterium TMED72]